MADDIANKRFLKSGNVKHKMPTLNKRLLKLFDNLSVQSLGQRGQLRIFHTRKHTIALTILLTVQLSSNGTVITIMLDPCRSMSWANACCLDPDYGASQTERKVWDNDVSCNGSTTLVWESFISTY